MTKKKIALIFGGQSPEHEISVISAKNVAKALDQEKFDSILIGISTTGTWFLFSSLEQLESIKTLQDHELRSFSRVVLTCENLKPQFINLKTSQVIQVDVAFPIMHGTRGEDGCVQGYFKMMNLPFVGCGVAGSAIGMDKEIMKRLLKIAGIPSANYLLLTPDKPADYKNIVEKLGTPFFIKPANMGSSVGVHKVKSEAEFAGFLKDAFMFDYKVLAEEFIQGREIEISVMGHNRTPKVSLAGEVIPHHEFYSYQAKYLDENGAGLRIPAQLLPEQMAEIQALASRTYKVLECDGLTRVDFFLRGNAFLVNEVNTIPGFTSISMYPKMWEASGISYRQLISNLIQLAFEKFEAEQALQTKFLR